MDIPIRLKVKNLLPSCEGRQVVPKKNVKKMEKKMLPSPLDKKIDSKRSLFIVTPHSIADHREVKVSGNCDFKVAVSFYKEIEPVKYKRTNGFALSLHLL